MPPTTEVLTVQYPGRQDRMREPCAGSVEELADGAFQSLLPWTDLPFVIFGHSMGASVGFELALRLEAAGAAPALLFASGRGAPGRLIPHGRMIHPAGAAALRAEIETMGGTGTALLANEQIMEVLLPVIMSDYRIAETYHYQGSTKLGCSIVVLIGADDARLPREDAVAWADHTTAGISLHVFPGGHFYLDTHLPELINLVCQDP
jgi:surfactin synthase thioesterase subunit